MVREENIVNAIAPASKDKSKIVDRSGRIDTTVGYTANSIITRDENGDIIFTHAEEIDPDDPNCYAKLVLLEKADGTYYKKYFVKVGVDGQIFNPWGMFSEGTQKRYAKTLGKPQWAFTDVSEKCFTFYTNFLQSRNKAWLNNAERSLI